MFDEDLSRIYLYQLVSDIRWLKLKQFKKWKEMCDYGQADRSQEFRNCSNMLPDYLDTSIWKLKIFFFDVAIL